MYNIKILNSNWATQFIVANPGFVVDNTIESCPSPSRLTCRRWIASSFDSVAAWETALVHLASGSQIPEFLITYHGFLTANPKFTGLASQWAASAVRSHFLIIHFFITFIGTFSIRFDTDFWFFQSAPSSTNTPHPVICASILTAPLVLKLLLTAAQTL